MKFKPQSPLLRFSLDIAMFIIHFHIVCDCFPATMTWSGGCERDRMVHKALNIHWPSTEKFADVWPG